MVFISKNLLRKCKYCFNEPKRNINKSRNKGYLTTCGSKECLRAQYDDFHVCISKGRIKNPVDYVCVVCSESFIGKSGRNKKYCKECVPDNSWRTRAARYRIGKKQWDLLLKKQNDKCALCERNPEVVDHCHKKGIVRGLLCSRCNINLSVFERDQDYLDRVLKYTRITNV